MNGREFVRRVRQYARSHRLTFDYDPRKGKGSHGEVSLGIFRTTVQYGELSPGMLASMLRDLNIDRRDF